MMKIKPEKFVTPSGEVLEGEVTGVSGHPPGLVWRRRLRIGGLLFLIVFVFAAPFLQALIPRSSNSFASSSLDVPTPTLLSMVVVPTPTNLPVLEVLPTPTNLPLLVTATPTKLPSPAAYVPQVRVIVDDCFVYDFPDFSSVPVGAYVRQSVLYPSAFWTNQDGIWYFIDGLWLSPLCTVDDLTRFNVLPFLSPPMRRVTPTMPVRVRDVPVQQGFSVVAPTATVPPRWNFAALPSGFNPGWCVAVKAKSVWLPDGSRYFANDGMVYLSDGVLHQSLTVEVSGWYEDFVPWECGRYN